MEERKMRPRPRRSRRKVCKFCVEKATGIDYKTEGFYVLVTFNAPADLPKELERNFRNDERVLRYMVTRKEA